MAKHLSLSELIRPENVSYCLHQDPGADACALVPWEHDVLDAAGEVPHADRMQDLSPHQRELVIAALRELRAAAEIQSWTSWFRLPPSLGGQ